NRHRVSRVVVDHRLRLCGVEVGARSGVFLRDAFRSTVVAWVSIELEAGPPAAGLRITYLPLAVTLMTAFARATRRAPGRERDNLLEGGPVDPGHGRHTAHAHFVVGDVVERRVALGVVGLPRARSPATG